MQRITIFVAGGLALSMMVLSGLVVADDTGFGACVLGNGFDINDASGSGPYRGVNVGESSGVNVYEDAASYEAQCCAETGQPPDCFAPVDG